MGAEKRMAFGNVVTLCSTLSLVTVLGMECFAASAIVIMPPARAAIDHASTLPPVNCSVAPSSRIHAGRNEEGNTMTSKTTTSVTLDTGSNVASVIQQHHIIPSEHQRMQQQEVQQDKENESESKKRSGARKREIDSFPGSIAPGYSSRSSSSLPTSASGPVSVIQSKILLPSVASLSATVDDVDLRLKRDGER